MRVIELDTAETFYSLRHRLLSGGRGRVVLVVPGRGTALRGGVDLPLLRRLADRERLEVGLVTADRDLARRARAVGLPTFSSLTLAEHYRPGWWRGRRRAERLGLSSISVDRLGREEAHAKDAKAAKDAKRGFPLRPLPASRPWRALFFLILLLLIFFALPIALAVYVLPQATITLRPATQPAQAIVEVTADPAAAEIDPAALAVPARAVALSLPWAATGSGRNAAARQQVRALALQALNAGAADRLAARLAPGEWLAPGATRVTIRDEQFTTVGGDTRLTLQAELTGLAVAAADVYRLVYPALARALPAGYAPDPATVATQVEAGGAPDRLLMTAQATGRAQLDPAGLAAQLAGQRLSDAAATLNALPLAEPPHFDVGPSGWLPWFGRLPFRPERITIHVTE